MTTERKNVANRINTRKSTGPRTRVGKARASRNALRHGLAAVTHRNPVLVEKIEQMTKEICGKDDNPLLLEQARTIAENDVLLCCVRAERLAVIERLRDPKAIPLANGNNSLAVARARALEMDVAIAELKIIEAKVAKMSREQIQEQLNAIAQRPVHTSELSLTDAEERDEHCALCEAMPDIDRLSRYERRAWSRRKRAIREFIEIKFRKFARDAANQS